MSLGRVLYQNNIGLAYFSALSLQSLVYSTLLFINNLKGKEDISTKFANNTMLREIYNVTNDKIMFEMTELEQMDQKEYDI